LQERIKEQAEDRDYAWRTVMRAKKDLGVKSTKHRFDGKWTWKMPDAGQDLRYMAKVANDEECQTPPALKVAPFDKSGTLHDTKNAKQDEECQFVRRGEVAPLGEGQSWVAITWNTSNKRWQNSQRRRAIAARIHVNARHRTFARHSAFTLKQAGQSNRRVNYLQEIENMTDQTFTAVDLTAEHPPGICAYCVQHGIEHMPSGVLFVYCFHTETGAHRRPGETWTRCTGFSASDFKTAILSGVLKFENVILSTEGMTRQWIS